MSTVEAHLHQISRENWVWHRTFLSDAQRNFPAGWTSADKETPRQEARLVGGRRGLADGAQSSSLGNWDALSADCVDGDVPQAVRAEE